MVKGPFVFSDHSGYSYEWVRPHKEPELWVWKKENPSDRQRVRNALEQYKGLKLAEGCFQTHTMEVLGCFLNHPNEALSWKEIEAEAWPETFDSQDPPKTSTEASEVVGCVSQLRKLFFDPKDKNGDSLVFETIRNYGYKFLLPVEPQPETDGDGLPAALNAKFGYLNDLDFGTQIASYLEAQSAHRVYCHNLRTTFTFDHARPSRLQDLHAEQASLLDTCFDLRIEEKVDKTCGDKVRFLAFLDAQLLARHLIDPEYDFVWNVDLPDDAHFKGKVSDIFKIELIEIDRATVHSARRGITGITKIKDDSEQFAFEVDVSGTAAKGPLRELKYEFQTLKSKDARYVSYGTRVLTRGATIKVEFASETGVGEAVVMTPHVSGFGAPKPSEFGTKELSLSGWLLPRSGVTFSFRYDKPYRLHQAATPAFTSAETDRQRLRRLLRSPIHSYHLTQGPDGNPAWYHKILTFDSITTDGRMVAHGVNLPPNANDSDREEHEYEYDAWLDRRHLIVRTRRQDEQSPDMSIQLFPNVGQPQNRPPWWGMDVIATTWSNNPAQTISIWNPDWNPVPDLEGASTTPDGKQISDPWIIQALEDLWRKAAERAHAMQLSGLRHFKTDAEAFKHLANLYSSESLSPKLLKIRDTHARADTRPVGYGANYRENGEAFSKFLARGDERHTRAVVILGNELDEDYVDSFLLEPVKGHEHKIKFFHLAAPILSFIILDYAGGTHEVFFGWGRLESASGPGVGTGVFASKDQELVQVFSHYFDMLQRAAKPISAASLRNLPQMHLIDGTKQIVADSGEGEH
jgi:DNA-binding winged helix-turn-helix (wHTH) protein